MKIRHVKQDFHGIYNILVLGSASRDLIRQSSESLAGRSGYDHLWGFRIHDSGKDNINRLWMFYRVILYFFFAK